MAHVRKRVREERGFALRSEIRLVGFETETDPDIVDLLNKDSEFGVSTIRLEQVFAKTVVADPVDASIPLSVLDGNVVRIVDAEVSEEVLEELADAFGRDVTRDITVDIVQPEVAANTERVVIVDDDLRIVTDDDFPADTMSQSVHRAPTSTRIAIIDEDLDVSTLVDTSDEASADGSATSWSELSAGRRFANSLKQLVAFRGVSKRKKILIVGSSFVAMSILAMIVLASPIVAVRQIDVEGVKYANSALIETVSKTLRGKSVLTVDTAAAQKLLETDPWIESARIKTYLPSRAVIEVNERVPAAWFLGVDNQARVIDQDGRVLAVLNGRPTDYMLIDGIGPNLVAGAMASNSYTAAAQLAVSLPEEIRPVVKSMGVDGPEQVTMTLLTGAVVRFGEPVDLRNKLVNVVVILRRQDINQIAGIDVSSGTPVVTSP
jgi:cell division protein FtsQ